MLKTIITLYRIDINTFLEYEPSDINLVVVYNKTYYELAANFTRLNRILLEPNVDLIGDHSQINLEWYQKIDSEEWWKEFVTEEIK